MSTDTSDEDFIHYMPGDPVRVRTHVDFKGGSLLGVVGKILMPSAHNTWQVAITLEGKSGVFTLRAEDIEPRTPTSRMSANVITAAVIAEGAISSAMAKSENWILIRPVSEDYIGPFPSNEAAHAYAYAKTNGYGTYSTRKLERPHA